MVDYIPLSDVDYINEMKGLGESSLNLELFRDSEGAIDYMPTLQISTTLDGYNSGRAYYIQADSMEELARLKHIIQRNSKAAKKRVEARNLFRMWQLRTRKVYDSNLMQAFIALIIAAVMRGARPTRHHPPHSTHPRRPS